MSGSLKAHARAKINLSLHVLGRRDDGYHALESLVAFAAEGDVLLLTPGDGLSLTVEGGAADAIGDPAGNLVTRAALALSQRIDGLRTGHFHLIKNLPVASGIGGGSSDAAAALRLLAQANGIATDAPVLHDIAAGLGADVPVCLAQKTRIMRGTGTDLAPPIPLDPIPALLVNPGVAVETRQVFAALGLKAGERCIAAAPLEVAVDALRADPVGVLRSQRNDLTSPATRVAPVIADVLDKVGSASGCLLARMSGSGATVFGLFASQSEAQAAAFRISAENSSWWVRATMIGG
jgi:4-diphosphocytidyl-2-C-methyl-D-erythritol kinase